jgi:hypothetical protein
MKQCVTCYNFRHLSRDAWRDRGTLRAAVRGSGSFPALVNVGIGTHLAGGDPWVPRRLQARARIWTLLRDDSDKGDQRAEDDDGLETDRADDPFQ